MKKTKILIVLIIGVILFTMSTSVFALDDTDSNLNFYEDTSDQLETSTGTSTSTSTGTSTDTSTGTSTGTSTTTSTDTNYNTSLPKAGAPENVLIGISITVLAIIAIYAYRKTREYKNV